MRDVLFKGLILVTRPSSQIGAKSRALTLPMVGIREGNSKFRTVSLAAAVLLCSMALASCRRTSEATGVVKRYQLSGQIVRLEPQARAAVIKHQKIEGWMEAMTMEYPVKDIGEFRALNSGDRIKATIFVRGLDYWISDVHREVPQEK
jgi:Cu/Ag efflux protein CusF